MEEIRATLILLPERSQRSAREANQVRGQAGEHQVDGARKALGHAYGGGSQYFSLWIVGSEPL